MNFNTINHNNIIIDAFAGGGGASVGERSPNLVLSSNEEQISFIC